MGKTPNIAWHLAPTNFKAFEKWHKLACQNFNKEGKQTSGDPLTAEARWKLNPRK